MKPKIYLFPTLLSLNTPFIKLEDYQSLAKELKDLNHYCDKLVEFLPCLPKDIENLRGANDNFAKENGRLRKLLYRAGICPDCEEEVFHFVDEPFAACSCATGEDYTGPSTIQKLRMDNKKLLGLCEDLNAENKDLINKLEYFLPDWRV